jgi:hypothetical protein
VGFVGLIAACFVFARRFADLGDRGWAAYSVITGVVFFAAFFAIATGSGRAEVMVGFVAAAALSWGWFAALAARLMAALPDEPASTSAAVEPMLSA